MKMLTPNDFTFTISEVTNQESYSQYVMKKKRESRAANKRSHLRSQKLSEIAISDKKRYLKKNYPLDNLPKLKEKRECVCCNTTFKVGDYKVLVDKQGREFISCPNAPRCNGTVLDWF